MLRYLLGQVNSQKGGKSEAEHPNSHRWWHKSVEELEGIASSFWQLCAPSSKEAGAAGGRGPKALMVWRVLVPGAERGSPLAPLPPAFLGCLGKIP